MTQPGIIHEITLDARLDNLPHFRDFIDRSCRNCTVDDSTCHDIKMAVDEACTNIVTYGYKNASPGLITLVFFRDTDRIVIKILDNAEPFHPENAPEPDMDAPWEKRGIGGLGMYLIGRLMDEISYQSGTEAGNCLTLVKRFPRLENEQPVNS